MDQYESEWRDDEHMFVHYYTDDDDDYESEATMMQPHYAQFKSDRQQVRWLRYYLRECSKALQRAQHELAWQPHDSYRQEICNRRQAALHKARQELQAELRRQRETRRVAVASITPELPMEVLQLIAQLSLQDYEARQDPRISSYRYH